MHWHAPGPVRRPPGFIEPCLPTNGNTVPLGPQWVYEIKHDGFRFICRRDGDRCACSADGVTITLNARRR